MAQAAGDEGQLHLLMVPFQQEGHIAGMLKFAQALAAQEGVLVTFAYPARAHGFAKKHNKLPSLPSLRYEVVHDGLPLDEELTLTHELVHDSMAVFQSAVRLLLDVLLHPSEPSGPLPPLCCILSDTFQPWTQALANAVGLPRVDYWPCSATVYSMGTQFPRLVSTGTLPLPESSWLDVEKKWSARAPLIDCVPGVPPFPPTDFPPECVQPDVSDISLQFFKAAFECTKEAHTIVMHSVYELEREVCDAMQANGLTVLLVGPIQLSTPSETLPLASNDIPKPILSHEKAECIQWLDTQRPASVIYVALGSMGIFTPAETHSLAHALEASGLPFIWVIREDSVSDSISEVLPEGFLQRTVEKGVGLIVAWAPQTQVLSHQSTAAFFTHCGWNSCLESMWDGVPVLTCPRAAEQRANARLLVENWKMGVEVERQHDGSFTKEGVQRAFKEVFNVAYKENALHVKKVSQAAVQKGGSSHTNLAVFLQRLRQM